MSSVVPDPALNDWVPMWNAGANIPPTQPSVRVYRSTTQSIPNGAWTALSFDAERWDSDSIHDNVTNPSYLTCRTAGKYLVTFTAGYTANATGMRGWCFRVNGGQLQAVVMALTMGAGQTHYGGATVIVDLAAGDYIECLVYQNSGGNLTVTSEPMYSPEAEMALFGGMQGPPGIGVPTPVVNGQWIKGSGGAAVWSPIAVADLPSGIPGSKIAGYPGTQSQGLMGDGTWQYVCRQYGSGVTYSMQSGVTSVAAAVANGQTILVNITNPWPNAHGLFFGMAWPTATWSLFRQIAGGAPANTSQGYVAVDNGTSAQNLNVYWFSLGY